MTKIMCVDPGFAHTGVVIMEFNKGTSKWTPVYSTVISTKKNSGKTKVRAADDTAARCKHIYRGLAKIADEYQPKAIAAELPSGGGKSSNAVKAMGIATAIIASLTEQYRLPEEWVTPTDVKKAVTGTKNASKLVMETTITRKWPELGKQWTHQKGAHKGKFVGDFEHVADAAGVFEAVADGTVVRMLEQM